MNCDMCYCLSGDGPYEVDINDKFTWKYLCPECKRNLEEMGADVQIEDGLEL